MKKLSLAALFFAFTLVMSGCGIDSEYTSYDVPDFEGTGLSTAQKAVKDNTNNRGKVEAYYIQAFDKKIEEDNQEWKVCSQSVPKGKTVDKNTIIKLGIVIIDEDCPPVKTYDAKNPEEGTDKVQAEEEYMKMHKKDKYKKDTIKIGNYANKKTVAVVNEINKKSGFTLENDITVYALKGKFQFDSKNNVIDGSPLTDKEYRSSIVCYTDPGEGMKVSKNDRPLMLFVAKNKKECKEYNFYEPK